MSILLILHTGVLGLGGYIGVPASFGIGKHASRMDIVRSKSYVSFMSASGLV